MRKRLASRWLAALLTVVVGVLAVAASAGAVTIVTVPAAPMTQSAATPRVAPSPQAAEPQVNETEDDKDEPETSGSSDVLRDNGLRSPWCSGAMRSVPGSEFFTFANNCASSGISSISGSGDDVQFDWHIDTSDGPLGTPDMSATFLSWMVNMMGVVWSLMVAITKAAFLSVEFALSFNPLAGHTIPGLSQQVRTISGTLAAFCGVMGGLTILWRGAVQQRVAEALSTAILGFGLATIALLVLANPAGTVGAAITGAQKVGLYVIGAAADAQPAAGRQSAQRGLRTMGDALVDQPLAVLEFGDVRWGTSPRLLDAKLRETAIARATKEGNAARLRLVRAARTNLRLWEAWPANSPARNSINQEDSLLRVLCGSDDVQHCKGPNAARAEFRGESGVWQRAIALLLIAFPLAASWAVLFLVAYKVLGGMLMSVIYLLQLVFIAPFAVAGKAGTDRLIRYGGSYLAAILSVCTYSCLLALVMSMWRLISSWTQYGWAVQWLLLGFALVLLLVHHRTLWGYRRQMDHTLGAVGHRGAWLMAGIAARSLGRRSMGRRRPAPLTGQQVSRRAQAAERGRAMQAKSQRLGGSSKTASTAETTEPAPVDRAAGEVPRSKMSWRGRPNAEATYVPSIPDGPPSDRQVAKAKRERKQQVTALLSARRADDEAGAPNLEAMVRRRDHVSGLRQDAWYAFQAAAPNSRVRRHAGRRLLRLVGNERALETSLNDAWAQRTARSAPRSDAAVRNERRDTANWLDRQYRLPRGAGVPSGEPQGGERSARERRDYAGLAALAGSTPQSYREAKPEQQVRMRAKIDRELRSRAYGHAIIRADRAVSENGSPQTAPESTPRPRAGRSHERPRVNVRDAARRAATPRDS